MYGLLEFDEKEAAELKILSENSGIDLTNFYDIEDNWDKIKEIVKEFAPDLYEWKIQIDLELDPNGPYNQSSTDTTNDSNLQF